jgi:hypothetical protein
MFRPRSNKLFINFPFLLILPLSVLAYGDDDDDDDDDQLNNPENIHNFHLVVGFSLTLVILGWLGCIYIFYRIYKQWILSKKRLAMIYRLPFYTACTGKNFDYKSRVTNYLCVLTLSVIIIRYFNT